MNCLFLLLLLCCCGNSNGVCQDTADRCCEHKHCHKKECHKKDCCCDNENNCCDVPGIIPPPWQDGPCDVRPPRPEPRMAPPPRNDYQSYGRGETCGCEEKMES